MNLIEGKRFFINIDNDIQFPYLNNNIKEDIVIIGAGVTGLIIAYYLNKNNIKTILVDKGRVGYSSTSITTALLQYELDDNINKLKEYFTTEELEEIYIGCNKALYNIEVICREINCKYFRKDCLLYTNKDIEEKDLYDEYMFRRNINLKVDFIKEHLIELKSGIISYGGGITINPYEFSIKLAKHLSNNNVDIYENTEVIKVDFQKNEIITKYDFIIYFNKVIVACGYNVEPFTKKQLGNISYTYNIVTNKSNINLERLIIRDNKKIYNYYRSYEGRVIAGGYDTVNYNLDNAEEIYEKLLNDVKKLYKNNNLKIEYKYAGVFKSTKDNLGYFGSSINNNKLIYALGYGANGILFAILGSNIILNELNNKKSIYHKYFNVDRK